MRYAFLNQDSIVVNVIVGDLTPEQLSGFLDDYSKLFAATQVVAVEQTTPVWIGGTYAEGVFAPPPAQPIEIVDSTAELLDEPALLEPEV
jgi:hypothetical protein